MTYLCRSQYRSVFYFVCLCCDVCMSFYRILPSPFASSVFYIAYTYRIESITLQSEMNTYKQPEMIIAIIAQYVKIMYDNKPVIRIELNSLL